MGKMSQVECDLWLGPDFSLDEVVVSRFHLICQPTILGVLSIVWELDLIEWSCRSPKWSEHKYIPDNLQLANIIKTCKCDCIRAKCLNCICVKMKYKCLSFCNCKLICLSQQTVEKNTDSCY